MKLMINLENEPDSERIERIKGRLEGDLLKFEGQNFQFSKCNARSSAWKWQIASIFFLSERLDNQWNKFL